MRTHLRPGETKASSVPGPLLWLLGTVPPCPWQGLGWEAHAGLRGSLRLAPTCFQPPRGFDRGLPGIERLSRPWLDAGSWLFPRVKRTAGFAGGFQPPCLSLSNPTNPSLGPECGPDLRPSASEQQGPAGCEGELWTARDKAAACSPVT